jgi:hypothetical protein
MRKLFIVAIALSALMLSACKSSAEKKGDNYLSKGMLKNALKFYLQVEKKGNGSPEFMDNYALAMTRLMMQVAQKEGVQQDIILNYTLQIPKMLAGSTNQAVGQEVVQAFSDIAKMRMEIGDYPQRLEAFRLLDSAKVLAKRVGAGESIEKQTRTELANAWAKEVIAENSNPSRDGAVVAEYNLLEVYQIVQDNDDLNAALDKVRKINRHNFLIWSPAVNDVNPNPDINNKYSGHFVMAFREGEFNPTPSSFKGALSIWNSSGGNVLLKPEQFTLVSKDGKEVANTSPISKECQTTENKELKSVTPGFEPEAECTTIVTFDFGSDFKPDYVKLNIKNATGIKYLAL